ncbi:MAG: glycosyltransferase [Firmicutes bacterium]|nr:glycosyltransferase [Bacillota bacterium]
MPRVTVLDMQPIDPPTGGGRIRLLGLYHGLGERFPTTYIGTYDWPGPSKRQHKLSATLEEIDIPLSKAHFEVSEKWKYFFGGRTVIDTAFPLMAHLSPEFIEGAKSFIKKSDIVIFSHPWVYPLVRETIDLSKQLIVYDSHNFEGMLRTELLDDGGFGTEIAKHVVTTEYELSHRADIILACSKEDCQYFNQIYGVDDEKIIEVPNGVFSTILTPPTPDQKELAKISLKLRGKIAIFLGSAYGPNIEAVKFICYQLAPYLPDLNFVICGGVSDAVEVDALKKKSGQNIHFTGFVSDELKLKYLWAADIGINPMFSGSGTNIKMFDFMSVGLPIVATQIGARGIDTGSPPAFIVSDVKNFLKSIERVLSDKSLASQLGKRARETVESQYSWEKISSSLGHKLGELLEKKRLRDASEDRVTNKDILSISNSYGGCQKENQARDFGFQNEHLVLKAGGKIGIITTWGIRCGIAEYSKYLVEALSKYNYDCLILSNITDESVRSDTRGHDVSSSINVKEIWRHGNIQACDVIYNCKVNGVNKLNIQYHAGFFNEESLINIVGSATNAGIEVSVTLHNTKIMEIKSLNKMVSLGAKLIIHSADEIKRLKKLGIKNLIHIPHGVLDIPDELSLDVKNRLGLYRSPLIGTFGFLRPHKGVCELIEAVQILRDLFPNIGLLGMNALYPSDDSENYLKKCNDLINNLKLREHVTINTHFLDIEKTVSYLHACDLIVLPYHYSNEGASGSAHIAIAAKRPLIVTRQEIFKDISSLTYQVENTFPSVLAVGIASVLSSPLLLQNLKEKNKLYIDAYCWSKIANEYLKVFFVEEKPIAL